MPVHDKIALLRGLLSRDYAYAGPFAVTVEVTRRCNLLCAGCPYHSPHLDRHPDPADRDLDIGLFAELCAELTSMDTRLLVFCGEGEPLLHSRFSNLLRLAKGAGFRVILITNGTLLDEAAAKSLIDNRLDVARVSLWATSPEEFRNNYPGTDPRYYGAAVKGLKLLHSHRTSRGAKLPRTELHVVLNRFNWRSVDSFIDLALEARADAISFSPWRTTFGRLSSMGLSGEEERALETGFDRARKRLREAAVDHNIGETIHRYRIGEAVRRKSGCYMAWTHPRIRVDGTVIPCAPCDLPMGSLREQSFREIWNGPAYASFRRALLTPSESHAVDRHCDCSFCCHLSENERIDRIFRWFSPLGHIWST